MDPRIFFFWLLFLIANFSELKQQLNIQVSLGLHTFLSSTRQPFVVVHVNRFIQPVQEAFSTLKEWEIAGDYSIYN